MQTRRHPSLLAPALAVTAAVLLCSCAWRPWKRHAAAPNPTEIVVNGAPVDSIAFVDGSAAGQPVARGQRSQILSVTSGEHQVEIRSADTVVYREGTYVAAGERRVITVLSGSR